MARTACAGLYASGDIEFPDAVAGATCKRVTEDPAALEGRSALAVLGITASCKYGQALGEAERPLRGDELRGLGPRQVMLDAVGELTGDHDPTRGEPDFPGWWTGNLPPGALP